MILYIEMSKIEKFPAGCALLEVFGRSIWKSSKFEDCVFSNLAFAVDFMVPGLCGKMENLQVFACQELQLSQIYPQLDAIHCPSCPQYNEKFLGEYLGLSRLPFLGGCPR